MGLEYHFRLMYLRGIFLETFSEFVPMINSNCFLLRLGQTKIQYPNAGKRSVTIAYIVTSDNVTLPITNVVGARIMRYVMSQNGSRLFWALTMAFFKKRCHLILRYRLLKHCHHSQSHSQSLFVCKCLKHPFTGNIKSPLEAMCT